TRLGDLASSTPRRDPDVALAGQATPSLHAPAASVALAPAGQAPSCRHATEHDECTLSVQLYHRRRLHGALLEALDLRRRDIASMSDEALHSEASLALQEIISADTELPPGIDRSALLFEV